jgi:sigma-E factor negative regulatory protein RseA
MKHSNEISNMNQSTQQSHGAISAWMDGDAETDMPAHLTSTQGQSTWALYHLIGDTLRTPALALPETHSLQQRISQAIAQEPAIVAAPAPASQAFSKPAHINSGPRFWSRTVWPGVAMAAAVASVIWVAKPFLLPELSPQSEQIAQVIPAQPLRATEVAFNAPVVRDYVNTHREISGPANVRQVSFGAMR